MTKAKSFQITTIYGRNKMAKALAGQDQLPKITGIAFGNAGHESNRPQDGKVLASNRADLFNRVVVLPVESYSFPEDGVVRFSVQINPDSITGGYFSEAAIVDSEGKALAIQTFGIKSVAPNETMYYDWEEVI